MKAEPEHADSYRWVILGVLWTTYVVVFLHRLSVGPLGPFFKEDLSATSTQVGLVMSAASFGYLISIFPTGWLVDRVGARWPIVAGEFIAGACMIVLFFVPSYKWLLALMFVTGFGCGFLLPSTTQAVVAWFPIRERATVMGFKQTAVNVGGIVSAATLPSIAIALGWRYGFLFLGILAVIIGTIALLLYREPSCSMKKTAENSKRSALPLSEIFKSREIWILSICGLCFTWVEMAMIAHLVLYLTEALLFGAVFAGGLLAMSEVAGAVMRPLSGIISDRVFGGRRKQVFMIMAAIVCAMSAVLGLAGPHLGFLLYPVLLLLGIGGIAFGGIWLTMLAEFGGKRGAGKAVGLGGMIGISGGAIGPPVFGFIVDKTGSYSWAWLSLTATSLVCFFLIALVREEKRRI